MPSAPHRADLEGYLEGVTRRLGERRAAGPVDARLGTALEEARAALATGKLVEADRLLRALDRALDDLTPEMELTERPRGLVGYRALGDPGVPPGPEEERLANRIRLVGRLAAIRESTGGDVREIRDHLAAAQSAYDAGDRAEARREVDRAHQLLESGDGGGRTP